MPKQEYKIQEFHGGTNDKFDPRDIADNQNAYSQISVRHPGRLTLEGSGNSLYDKTRLNHKKTSNYSTARAWETGYGLFTFSHDYNMDATPSETDTDFIVLNDQADIDIYDPNNSNISTDIIQDGTDPNPADSNWTRVLAADGSAAGWTTADPPAFADGSGTASLVNTLGGDKIDAGFTYSLTFTVAVATLDLLIGGDDNATGSSNLPSQTFIAKATYAVGTHTVHFQATVDRSHLWFTAYDSSGGAGTIDNVTCYRTGWTDAKFTLGSRSSTVKPEYYNVDGSLRTCDSNFSVTSASAQTAAAITKNDATLSLDNGAGGDVTIASGSLIQIDQEIIYIVTGTTGTSFTTVIRGFANTKAAAHLDNTTVYYVNVPKYFGHIKDFRLNQCATANSINTWVEDIQTPQPPNNTRKSDGTTGTLANSLGVQSLRKYNSISASTSNYPAESEKVVLEFDESLGNTGIIKITHGSFGGANFKIKTSGYGNSASGNHRLLSGDMIDLTDMQGVAVDLQGQHEVVASLSATEFTIHVEDGDSAWALDYETSEAFESSITDFADYSNEDEAVVDNGLKVVCGTSDDDFTNTSPFPIHITGETGVNAFNGIYIGYRIDDDSIYISNPSYGSHASANHDGAVHQLVGIVRPVDSGGVINEDLKRKWDFAMSFTYDGPAQEVQESLLTMGYRVEQAVQADGTPNDLNDTTTGGGIDTNDTPIEVKDNSTFAVNDVIMIGTEQMLVTAIESSDHLAVTRGYNGTTADSHTDGAEVFKITELSATATVDWTNFVGVPECVIKSVYNHGVDEKTWNARINGFKIYMKDVTEGSSSQEWRLFSKVNFTKGTYQIFAADDSELILEQPGTWTSDGQICSLSSGTELTMQPIDTYVSENMFTPGTIIDAQYKASEVVGRRVYIGNIRQGGRSYPDRMLRSPINKFDTFPETNYIDVAVGDGDSIVKLMSYGDRLLQFKKKKLYVINVSGSSEVLESEHQNAGIRYPSHACKTNNGICWFNESGLWFFDGKQVVNLTRHVSALTIDMGNTFATSATSPGFIMFERSTNRVIWRTKSGIAIQNRYFIYDFELNAFQSHYWGPLFPMSGPIYASPYTNIVTDSDGVSFFGFTETHVGGEREKTNFYKWSNDSFSDIGAIAYSTNQTLWKSKDVDFGSPAVDKRIYKVYVTYKCTGVSGVKCEYALDGSGSFSDFSSNKGKIYQSGDRTITYRNYDIRTPSLSTESIFGGGFQGERTGFITFAGIDDTDEAKWRVAELIPESPINNAKSIQLRFKTIAINSGVTAQTGGSSTTIKLNASESGDVVDMNKYRAHWIYIYDGACKLNSAVISSWNNSTKVATINGGRLEDRPWADNGYGAFPDVTSYYLIGIPAEDFEINDITIVYRPKRVK